MEILEGEFRALAAPRHAEAAFESPRDWPLAVHEWPLAVHEARPYPESRDDGNQIVLKSPAIRSREDALLDKLNAHAADADPRGLSEIVFVSTDLGYNDYLVTYLDSHFELRFLSAEKGDAFEQIARALEETADAGTIHFIGHGDGSRLFLGGSLLDAASMESHHRFHLHAIGQSLPPCSELFIYGGDFGSGPDGPDTINRLEEITGLSVMLPEEETRRIMPTFPAAADAPEAPRSGFATVTLTLSVSSGGLTLTSWSDVTFLGGTRNGDSHLVILGTVTDLNAALDGLVFTPAHQDFEFETLSILIEAGDGTPGLNLQIPLKNRESPLFKITKSLIQMSANSIATGD